MSDVVRALPLAIHAQKRSAHHFLPLGFNETGPDDDVDVARFVFDGKEYRPLGHLRPLPDRDDPAAACKLVVVLEPQQILGGGKPLAVQPLAQERQWMLAQREAEMAVVVQRIFRFRRCLKWQVFFRDRRASQQALLEGTAGGAP